MSDEKEAHNKSKHSDSAKLRRCLSLCTNSQSHEYIGDKDGF